MSTIGVDVGGTKVSIAVLEDGELSEPSVEPTEKATADELVDQLARRIEEVRGPGTEAVGLGIPAAVEFSTGAAKSGVNVPLAGVPLRHVLTERLGLSVFVDNDANVAALAEAHDGGRLVTEHLVMFTVGTGVGGGLVLGGRLYRGVTGAGAEMGHILVGLDLSDGAPPPADHFPQPGSLEALASGTALDGLARDGGAAQPRRRARTHRGRRGQGDGRGRRPAGQGRRRGGGRPGSDPRRAARAWGSPARSTCSIPRRS